jgi:cytochrome c oxidase subunit II
MTPGHRVHGRASRAAFGAGWIGLATCACSGVQSALAPGGREAEHLARVFWWLTGGALSSWVLVMGIALYAVRAPERRDLSGPRRLIVWGGVIVPTLTLTAVAASGLSLLPEQLAPAPPGSLRIAVTGEQYWWRVRYLPPAAAPVDLANEIRLPAGEQVELVLDSRDVIHSFWIPSLGGKVDMIPGRTTRLRLSPTRPGLYRGTCAEYCGASHAFMSFAVVVQEKAEFERWLAAQAAPAREPREPLARQGHEVLLANGCGACHALRGTPADGGVGPDLTHVGGRLSLGAGLLPNRATDFAAWVSATRALKPGVHMPAFGMLPAPELTALAAYLESLQ